LTSVGFDVCGGVVVSAPSSQLNDENSDMLLGLGDVEELSEKALVIGFIALDD
jgi:hypothetical protein